MAINIALQVFNSSFVFNVQKKDLHISIYRYEHRGLKVE